MTQTVLPRRRGRRRLLVTVSALLALPATGASAAILPAIDTTEQIGPGMSVRHLQYPEAGGWVDAFVLTADLTRPGVKMDLLHPPTISQGMVLTQQAARRGAIAGVNADFFDINQSYAAQGAEVTEGQVRKSPSPVARNRPATAVDGAGKALLSTVAFSGSVRSGSTRLADLAGLNVHAADAGTVIAYTPEWGTFSRARAVAGASSTREVLVRDGVVVSTGVTPGSGAVPSNGFYLVGREAGASALAGLQVGDPVEIGYDLTTSSGDALRFAVGGGEAVLMGGVVQTLPSGAVGDPLNPNPRTGIGFSRDGGRVFLAAVDGRRTGFPGVLQSQLGELLRDAGAWDGQNLDGGGSTEMVARPAGGSAATIRNRPSDGTERTDANGVGLFLTAGNGTARTLLLDPDGDVTRSSGAPARVFAGSSRLFRVASAVDAGWGPAALPSNVTWTTSGGRIDGDGTLHAPPTPGTVTVTATAGAAGGTARVQVLGAPRTVTPSTRTVAFGSATGATTSITLSGTDAEGFSAPLPATGATLTVDRAVADTTVASNGAIRITPRGVGATVLRVTTGSATSEVGITVGSAPAPPLDRSPVADRLVSAVGGATVDWSFAGIANPGIATATDANADATVGALEQIRTTDAELVVVAGGVTSSGGAAQISAAQAALVRGGCLLITGTSVPTAPVAGKLPCVVTPGDSDRTSGTLDGAFGTAFGAPLRSFVHKRTRFVLLDSSSGTVIDASNAQLRALAAALDGAAADAAVDQVVVVSSRSTEDPHGDVGRTLTDARENAVLDEALSRFTAESDKPVSLLSGGGRTAHVRRLDGATTLTLPSLTAPRGTADAGGFVGWARIAVDRAVDDGIRADVRPLGTAVALDAPAQLAVGASTPLTATVDQPGRTVPLAYPASPRWIETGELAVGSGATAADAARAAGKRAIVDPRSGTLTGLGDGTVTVAIEADAARGGERLRAERTVQVGAGTVTPDPGDGRPPVVSDPGTGLPPLDLGPAPGVLLPTPTATARVRVVSASGTRTRLKLAVRAPRAGKLRVTARLSPKGRKAVTVPATTTTVRRAGVVRVTITPSKAVRRALAKVRASTVTARLTVRFTPTGGKATSVTRSFRLRG